MEWNPYKKQGERVLSQYRGTPALPQILVTNLSPEVERGLNEEAMLDPVKVRVAGKLATKEMESCCF